MDTLYASIKDDLLAKIKNGTYAEGETIPSEVDLAREYGVSRPTIRQALQVLANAGYLDRRKRRGTVVSNSNAEDTTDVLETDRSRVEGVQSFEDEIRATGKTVRTMAILVKRERADGEVAEGLHVAEGSDVYKLVRLRYVNDVPNVFMENYVPCNLFPLFLENTDFSETRLYERMRELGRPVKTVTRRLEVIKADASLSALLDVPIGDPLFFIHTLGQDAEGNIIEFSVSTYRGRSNRFEFTVAEPSGYQSTASTTIG